MISQLYILACGSVVASASCPSTCYRGTCDYWDGGYWGTCSSLERSYGCDCSGCTCDGCPQGDCGSTPFNPAECPFAGNGKCDSRDNTYQCAWDGGDCCEETCVGTLCGSRGYDCKMERTTMKSGASEASSDSMSTNSSTMSTKQNAVSPGSGATMTPASSKHKMAAMTEDANVAVLMLRVSAKEPGVEVSAVLHANGVVLEAQLLEYFGLESVRVVAMRQNVRRLSTAIENLRVTFQSTGAATAPAVMSSLAEVLQRAFDGAAMGIQVHEAVVEWPAGGAGVTDTDSGDCTAIIAAAVAGGLLVLCAAGLLVFWRCRRLEASRDATKQEAPPAEAVPAEKITDDANQKTNKTSDDDDASTVTPTSDENNSV